MTLTLKLIGSSFTYHTTQVSQDPQTSKQPRDNNYSTKKQKTLLTIFNKDDFAIVIQQMTVTNYDPLNLGNLL